MIAVYGLLSVIRKVVMQEVTMLSFAVMFVIICAVFNGIFFGLFGRAEELGYLLGIVKSKRKKN